MCQSTQRCQSTVPEAEQHTFGFTQCQNLKCRHRQCRNCCTCLVQHRAAHTCACGHDSHSMAEHPAAAACAARPPELLLKRQLLHGNTSNSCASTHVSADATQSRRTSSHPAHASTAQPPRPPGQASYAMRASLRTSPSPMSFGTARLQAEAHNASNYAETGPSPPPRAATATSRSHLRCCCCR